MTSINSPNASRDPSVPITTDFANVHALVKKSSKLSSSDPSAPNTNSVATATADFSKVRAAAGAPHLSGIDHEAQLIADGKMPNLRKAEKLNEEERAPGEEGKDGEKIVHKHWLGRVLHREAKGANEF